jgi:hypothetical protein
MKKEDTVRAEVLYDPTTEKGFVVELVKTEQGWKRKW